MNFKTTYILLIMAAICAGIWILAGKDQPAGEDTTETPQASEARYIFDPRPEFDDLVGTRITRSGQAEMVFERSGEKDDSGRAEEWRMTQPLSVATQSYMVDGIGRMLVGLQYRRSFEPGEGQISAADAGLEPPLATFAVVDKDGKEYALEIGKKVALSNDTYVRVAGADEIYVVGRDMANEAKRKPNDYRAKTLVTNIPRNDIKHVHIEYGGKTYDFERGAEQGEWIINEPVKAYAEGEKVLALASALSTVRIDEFVDDAPKSLAPYGLDPAFLTIVVDTESRKLIVDEPEEGEAPATQPTEPRYETTTNKYALVVGDIYDIQSQKKRCVKLPDQPWVATADSSAIDKLVPKLAELRDTRVTRIAADDVNRLDLTIDGETTTLTKEASRWWGSGDLAEPERDAINRIVETIEDCRAIDYVDEPAGLGEYGLDHPRATLKIGAYGAVEPVELLIGTDTASGRNTYAMLAGQQSVMVIKAEQAQVLAPSPVSLRSRDMTFGKPEQVKSVRINRDGQRYRLERAEGGFTWNMLEPADAPADAGSMRDLVSDLARLRARTVVAKSDFAKYGLNKPQLTIEFAMEQPIAVEGPPTTEPAEPETEIVEHTLRVAQKDGQTYALIDDVPYVFELDQTVYRVLSQELIDRGLFDLEPDAVKHLKIEAPGGTVEFERQDGQWVYPPDPFVKLSQKTVGDFVSELAQLRVSSYMAYRDGDLAKQGLANAPVTVTMNLEDGSQVTLKIDQVRGGELPRKAAWLEQRRIFLLRPGEAEKLMRGLDAYVKPEPKDEEADD